jgi:hypothetical protein
MLVFCRYTDDMEKKKRGRPNNAAGRGKEYLLQVRLSAAEKAGFAEAAALSGEALSVWVRSALRQAAQVKLREHGHAVPFFPSLTED